MKNFLFILIFAVSLVSCYEDFRKDYEYTTVAFSGVDGGSDEPGVLWRTVVKGEGLDLDFGVYLAGVIENQEERYVGYTIDPSLLANTSYELMPESYYSLSNPDEFIIPSGEFIGKVNIELDSVQFLNDPKSPEAHYAIPFRLIETSADSILSSANTKILVIKYMNQYHGSYNQKGSYVTYDASGAEISSSSIENVIIAGTTGLNTVVTDGIVFKGPENMMNLNVKADGNVSLEYFPNPNPDNAPKNIAKEDPDVQISTSYVSPWEQLGAISDGYEPTNSSDKGPGAYGNWPNAETWNWVEYDFGQNVYDITQSDVYWWTDGGGILIPYEAYYEYWDIENDVWVALDHEGQQAADQYNTKELSLKTNRIRVNFIAAEAQGILEWKVWGTPVPTVLEQSAIESITALANDENSFDEETDTYTLNYRIDYSLGDFYTIVSTKLVWRNRIRDGVNEWRR